jgi:hypothetical protein
MHRRNFLRAASAGTLALPFLPSLQSNAGVTMPPKRLVFWFTGNGTIQNEVASGGVSDFTLGPILAPLAARRDDLLVLRGVDMESSYHGPAAGDPHSPGIAHMLTGIEMVDVDPYTLGGGISVDQHIAQELAAPTKVPTIDLGVAGGLNPVSPTANMSYHGSANPVIRHLDPVNAFAQYFSDLDGDATALAQLRARRGSILDFVGDETERLQAELGSEDRQRLQQHLDAVRELESTLAALGDLPAACSVPDAPPDLDIKDDLLTPQIGVIQMELMSMALACDLARVGTLQWGGALGANGTFSWLGHGESHHNISHAIGSPGPRQQKIEIDAWYATQLASFIDMLDALPEGDGTVFDNTAIVWCNELGSGAAHSRRDMIWVIAGSCGGWFDTGRFLQFGGHPHNDLLVSLCQAMDVDTQVFGNPAYCSGPLPGLT